MTRVPGYTETHRVAEMLECPCGMTCSTDNLTDEVRALFDTHHKDHHTEWITCPQCLGDCTIQPGADPQHVVTCPRCGGEGEIRDPSVEDRETLARREKELAG